MDMSCFQLFIIINNAVTNILVMAPGAHVPISGYTPNSGIVGSQGRHISNSVDTVFQIVPIYTPIST